MKLTINKKTLCKLQKRTKIGLLTLKSKSDFTLFTGANHNDRRVYQQYNALEQLLFERLEELRKAMRFGFPLVGIGRLAPTFVVPNNLEFLQGKTQ